MSPAPNPAKTRGPGHATGQQRNLERLPVPPRQPRQQTGKAAVMLLRQNLRGGQQRRLCAVERRDVHGRRGHGRLAAAHVALHHARHRHGARQVAPDLVQHALLRARQPERQRRPERLDHRIVRGQGCRLRGLQFTATLQHAELDVQEFVKGQPTQRRIPLLDAVRKMDLAQRIGQTRQRVRLAHVVGQWVRHQVDVFVQRRLDPAAQPLVAQPLGQAIDGGHPPRGHHLLVNLLKDGILQRLVAEKEADLAAKAHGRARLELTAHILVPPSRVQRARTVGQDALHHLAVHPHLAVADLPQIGDHRRLLARLQLGDRPLPAKVVVTAGQIPNEFRDPRDPQPLQ